MPLKDFATTEVTNTPGTSGTSIEVADGSLLIEGFATVHEENVLPKWDTAEVVDITNISGNTLTVTRAQKDTTAKDIQEDWRITNAVYADDINNKAEEGHTHTESDVTDLNHYDSNDFDTDFGNKSTTNLSEGTNLYYTEARVSANSDVSSNTSHRGTTTGNPHNVTKSDVDLGNVPNVDATNRTNHTGTQTTSTISDFLDKTYPVGAVYISVNSTDPGTLFGGTWSSFGAGRVLVGFDGSDSDFDTAEGTGGHKELQEHSHAVDTMAGSNALDHDSRGKPTNNKRVAAAHTDSGGGDNGLTRPIQDAGSGYSGNLQPYITVYMFKRTG